MAARLNRSVPAPVQRLFDLTRTTELFAIEPDREAALRALEFFAEFDPRLVGPVCRREHLVRDAIAHLFTVELAEVANRFLEALVETHPGFPAERLARLGGVALQRVERHVLEALGARGQEFGRLAGLVVSGGVGLALLLQAVQSAVGVRCLRALVLLGARAVQFDRHRAGRHGRDPSETPMRRPTSRACSSPATRRAVTRRSRG